MKKHISLDEILKDGYLYKMILDMGVNELLRSRGGTRRVAKMGVRGVVPSTLVRALQRFAVREDDATNMSVHVTRGLLLGSLSSSSSDETAVAVFGVLRDSDQRSAVLPHLPGGIAAVGSFLVWVTGEGAKTEDDEATEAAALAKKHVDTTVSPVVMVYVHESKRLYLFDSSWTVQPLEIVDCLHASDFIAATDSLILRSSVTLDAESLEQLTTLRKELGNNGSTSLFFQFPEDRKAIFSAQGMDVTSQEATASSEPLSLLVKIPEKRVAEAATTSNKSKKNKAKALYDAWDSSKQPNGEGAMSTDFLSSCTDDTTGTQYLKTLEFGEIAHVELLQSVAFTTRPNMSGTPPSVEIPSSHSTKTALKATTRVHVDALVVVSQSASVAETIKALRDELIKQISRLEALWTTGVESLQAHHFGLTGAAFPLTMPSTNGQLFISKATTTAIADSLLQPPARPLFDPSRCSLVSKAAVLADIDVLFNVHEGIPASGVPNGTQYLVDGFYGYYHYMQQAMNDKGWGCAYRSLQTLASWLFWNHYTTPSRTRSPTLTHREIQQTLVTIGDKPAAFVGSRDWIGSMEVGFVLDEVFGISFRTLNVSSGPELVSKAQELKHHFETQGTPVMMGGGQLAFTLLGIDYNASSGDCAFLILDPHYVGAEDLATIQTKTIPLEGYKAVPCGWRKASTFAKNSFYNLCLPQRPVE